MSESSTTRPSKAEATHVSPLAIHSDDDRRWLYPEPSRGRFWSWRLAVAWLLIAAFTALPLIPIGGHPAILLDVLERRFILFGAVFHATDMFYLTLFGLTVLSLVGLLTALLGRVWCGWGCPQTVYLEFVFRPIERLFEGSANERKRRDEGPWTFEKFWRKALKHSAYLAVALGLAHTFLAYFVGWERLVVWMTTSPLEHSGGFLTVTITTGLILFDFGYFREQMCVTVCPYAKLQSVLLDDDSMIVSYDPNRGEPRGRRSREQREEEKNGVELDLGDCIDCGACVRTCPTGIDIRDGLQLECVSCTQCVDACDDIMDRIGKPRGLIRYTSENALEEDEETRLVRPRVVVYALLFVLAAGSLGVVLSSLESVEVDMRRPQGASFRQMGEAGGDIANRVEFRIRNNTSETARYEIEATDPPRTRLKWIGTSAPTVEAGELGRTSAWVVIPVDAFRGGRVEATFEVRTEGERVEVDSVTLLGPRNGATGGEPSGRVTSNETNAE